MRAEFKSDSLKEENHLRNVAIEGRTLLKCI
jgi:hypothetical protein